MSGFRVDTPDFKSNSELKIGGSDSLLWVRTGKWIVSIPRSKSLGPF